MASEGTFEAGHFYFPTGGGALSIPLSFDPQGAIFFGGNQDAEDTLLHPTFPGLFVGMVWTDVDGGVDQQAQAITSFGTRWTQKAITSVGAPGSIEYEGTVALGSEELIVTPTDPAPGSRLVHYLAWGEFDGAEGDNSQHSGGGAIADYLSLGYRPLSALGFSMFASGASREGNNGSALYLALGVSNWPEEDTDDWNHNVMALAMRAQTQTAEGLTTQWQSPLETSFTYTVSSGLVGAWQDNWDHLQPHPTHTSEGLRLQTYGHPNVMSMAWWDCEASAHAVSPPNFGVETVTTVREYINEAQAVLFFGTTGYSSVAELNVNQAWTMGVCTKDAQGNGYQGCVAFDGGRGEAPADGTRSFFQSKQACLVNSLSPGGGVRVASGWLDGEDLHLVGEISSNPNIGPVMAQIWGKEAEQPDMWIMEV